MTLPVALSAECLADRATRGPRYTSYPPATEMRPIASATVARELEAVRAGRPVSIYVHIPFCRSLCWYCGCNVIPSRDASRGDGYVDLVATELAIAAEALGPGFPISEIALGGGSPNFLTAKAVRHLVATIHRYFTPTGDIRRSVELDPRSTTSSQVETFAAAGFRSMSVGVQDFSDSVQDAIHRHQSQAQTRWLIEHARVMGFRDINIDMVYGLPLQTEESFARTLDEVLQLEPDRIALFGYAHLPDKLPHQRLVERAGRVLDRYERATLLLLAIDRLTAAGYIHLGLDHFARPGSPLAVAATERRMVRTFQGYVEHRADTILGFGVTAISSTPRMIWQNHGELSEWERAITERRLPVARGVALDVDDQIRRAVIGKLMCDGEVDLAALGDELAIDARAYFARELASLSDLADLASYDPTKNFLTTTPLGRLLVRNVCMVFDRYSEPASSQQRFSSTI